MAEVTIQSRISQAYAKDAVVTFGPHDIPRGAIVGAILFDRTSWPAEMNVLRVDLEWSFDGGATWEFCGGFTTRGGDLFNATVKSPYSGMALRLPDPNNNRRIIRGSAQMYAGLTTAITLKVSDAPLTL